jgi:hypothetical protein
LKIIEELVQWENTTNEEVLERARAEIWQSWRRACADNVDDPRAKELFDRKKLPAFHDPFAGGGALPLEAQRLGLEAYACDLSPVAVLINKAIIEIPPRFAGKPPVNPRDRLQDTGYRAAVAPRRYPARIARQLALAHALQRRVDAGKFADHAAMARALGFTRARISQIMDLLLLAPDIQAEILHLEVEPGAQKITGRPLTHWVVPRFAAQSRHRLIFLTKSIEVDHALELEPTPQLVFSWSVNAEEVAARWEHGTPLPSQRFDAARRMKVAGWPVRFRLDPMVPYPRWRSGYTAAIREINRIGPEMVTLGALRATSAKSLRAAAKKNGRDDSIFDFLTEERDPSGFKYRIPFDVQVELFRFAIDKLEARFVPALCKEDQALWRALGLPFRGCHCLLDAGDALVEDAPANVQALRGQVRDAGQPAHGRPPRFVRLRRRAGP